MSDPATPTSSAPTTGSVTLLSDPRLQDARAAASTVKGVLAERGREARIERTATIIAGTTSALDAGDRFLVAVGDDRTFRDMADAILRRHDPDDPVTVGLVSVDRDSDVARTFGLPSGDPRAAAIHLSGDATYELDAVRLTAGDDAGAPGVDRTVHFTGIAEIGFGARLAQAGGRSGLRRFLGFWRAFFRSPAVRVRVKADRASWEGTAYQIVIGNGNYFGGGLKLSPRSFPGDGVVDLLAWHGPRSDAFAMLPKVYRGEQVPSPHVKEMRARIGGSIESDRPMPVHADGVLLGVTPARFVLMPKALRFKV